PQEAAHEVDPLCGATSHLASAVGAGLAGALVVGVLSMSVQQHLSVDPVTANELRTHLNLDKVAFVSNDRLQQLLELTPATPEQIAAAVQINTDARLFALKLSFFVLAGITLFGSLPAARVSSDDARMRPSE